MDQDDGDVVAAVELAQKAEQARDLGGAVLVEAVQPHQRVEQQQPRPQRRQRGVERLSISLGVEPQARRGDDVQVELGKRQGSVLAQLGDAPTDLRQRVLGEVDQRRPGRLDLESAQARRARGH